MNSAPRNYNMKFIFEYTRAGSFGYPSTSSGTYAWPQPYTADNDDNFQDVPASQLWWCDNTQTQCTGGVAGATTYLDRFYYDASQNLGQVAVGLLYGGFDDSNAAWTKDRVVAQQCGHVLMNTANEVSAGGSYWSTHQMPYMQVATWNDYEEGTETESGISNCYNLVTATIGGDTLSWTLGTNDSANRNGTNFANTDTIYEFAIWHAPHGVVPVVLTLAGQVAGNVSSVRLPDLGIKHGSTDMYVEMIGQAMMQNVMSNGVGPY